MVCEQWLNDFQTFYDWAMAHGYANNLSIDRINNDKGYSPENCRWITMREQSNNRGTNKYFLMDGQEKSIAEWCGIYGKKESTVSYRLRHGWTIEEALDLVPRKK